MKKYLVTLLVVAAVCFPKISNAYFGGEPFGASPFGIAKFGAGAFGEGAGAGIWDGFGVTFLKQYDTNQSSLDANTSSGSPTATFTASRGSTTPATTIETQDGNALLFDGVDDEVSIASPTDSEVNIYGVTKYSVGARVTVNSDGENSNGRILIRGASLLVFWVNAESGGTCSVAFQMSHSVTNASATSVATALTIEQEHHIVATYNEDDDKKIKIYVDGVLVSLSIDTAGDGTVSDDSGDELVIGNSTTGNRTFDGQIKDVRIYKDKSLTAAEALSRSNGGTVSGATAHWDFSDGSGTTVTDIVGSNDGTIAADSTAPQWLTDGSTYITKVTSDDTPRWTTGYYAQNGVYTAGPGLLLEGASTNLVPKSYTMDDASWTATNVTVADGAIADPMGGLNAASLTATAGNGTVLLAAGVTAQTYSVWLKRKTGTGNIDITADSGATYVTKTLTTAWKRFEVTAASASQTCGIRIVTSADAAYVWGNQFEDAAYPSSFIPTTTAALTLNAEALTYPVASNFVGGTDGSIALVYRPIMLPDEQGVSFKKLLNAEIDVNNNWTFLYSTNAADIARWQTRSGGTQKNADTSAEPYGSIRHSLHSLIGTYSTTASGGDKMVLYLDGSDVASNADYNVPVGALPSAFEIQPDANQAMILVGVALFDNRLSADQASDAHDILTGN